MDVQAGQLSCEASKRVVIKIGSALLTDGGRGLDKVAINDWARQIVELRNQGKEVLIVSSGSVAAGMTRLGLKQRPEILSELQAIAAVGQTRLVKAWEDSFQACSVATAQVLLVHDDLQNRKRYLNARNTLKALLSMGVIPIINENDTVATDEIRFGDNDTLAAVVANVIDADLLIILTDQDAMYTKDPRHHDDAEPIRQALANDVNLLDMAGDGGALGRGGMITKVLAARLAARSGAHTFIVGGHLDNVITSIFRPDIDLGTLLLSDQELLGSKGLWLASLSVCGELVLDSSLAERLRLGGESVLPAGVMAVSGVFDKGESVLCVDVAGNAVAQGVIGYTSSDVEKLLGVASEGILTAVGYRGSDELIHCDDLILL